MGAVVVRAPRFVDTRNRRRVRQWAHGGGFSLDAKVRVEAQDRKGLESLLRYCARPIFAAERLAWAAPGKRLLYH